MSWLADFVVALFERLLNGKRPQKLDRIPDPEPAWPHDYRSLYDVGACKRCGYANTKNWRPCVAPGDSIDA